MMYFKIGFLFSAALACTLAGCGGGDSGSDDDGSSGAGGSSATGNGSGGTSNDSGGSQSDNTSNDGTSNTTGGNGGGSACNPMDVGGGDDDECTEYNDCAQRECESDYAECLGEDPANGDFSGGACEDFMGCLRDCGSGDTCDTSCAQGCFGDISNACSSCMLAAGECGSEACPTEYDACFGETSTTTSGDTTTSGTTGGGGGTCMDLEECCNSLEGDAEEACLTTFEAIESSGDAACDLLLQSYQAAGQC